MRSLFIVLIGSLLLQGQEVTGGPPSIRVHGESMINAEPDQAELDVSVVTQASSSKAASDSNTVLTNKVVQELRRSVPTGDIKTVNFSVNPNYRYPKEGGTATITGYTADNTVRVRLADISNLRDLIDAATRAGASSINRLTFSLKDEKSVRSRALADAALEAEAGATALADALKLRLGHLLRVEEGQPVVVSPARQISLGRATSNDEVPLSPGTISVHADVNLTYEILGPQTAARDSTPNRRLH